MSRMHEPKLEPRSQWAADILERLALGGHGERVTASAREVLAVLRHGMKKHGRRKRRGARIDLAHAGGHLNQIDRGILVEPESGLLTRAHAAADCLLAFGNLVGLFDEQGEA